MLAVIDRRIEHLTAQRAERDTRAPSHEALAHALGVAGGGNLSNLTSGQATSRPDVRSAHVGARASGRRASPSRSHVDALPTSVVAPSAVALDDWAAGGRRPARREAHASFAPTGPAAVRTGGAHQLATVRMPRVAAEAQPVARPGGAGGEHSVPIELGQPAPADAHEHADAHTQGARPMSGGVAIGATEHGSTEADDADTDADADEDEDAEAAEALGARARVRAGEGDERVRHDDDGVPRGRATSPFLDRAPPAPRAPEFSAASATSPSSPLPVGDAPTARGRAPTLAQGAAPTGPARAEPDERDEAGLAASSDATDALVLEALALKREVLALATSNERLSMELALLTPGYSGAYKPWAPDLPLLAQRIALREQSTSEARERAERRGERARARLARVRGEMAAARPHPAERLAVLQRMEDRLHKSAAAFEERRLGFEAERIRNLELALQAFCSVAYHGGAFGELRSRYDDGGHAAMHPAAPGAPEPLLQTLARAASAASPPHKTPSRRVRALPALHTVTVSVAPPAPSAMPRALGDAKRPAARTPPAPAAPAEPELRPAAPLIPLPRLQSAIAPPERPSQYGG